MNINQKEDTNYSDNNSNSNSKMQNLVKDILISTSSKIGKKKQLVKRFKWNQENVQLFQQLYQQFLGDLDMIHSYFQNKTDFKFTKKQIKKKFAKLKNEQNLFNNLKVDDSYADIFESDNIQEFQKDISLNNQFDQTSQS